MNKSKVNLISQLSALYLRSKSTPERQEFFNLMNEGEIAGLLKKFKDMPKELREVLTQHLHKKESESQTDGAIPNFHEFALSHLSNDSKYSLICGVWIEEFWEDFNNEIIEKYVQGSYGSKEITDASICIQALLDYASEVALMSLSVKGINDNDKALVTLNSEFDMNLRLAHASGADEGINHIIDGPSYPLDVLTLTIKRLGKTFDLEDGEGILNAFIAIRNSNIKPDDEHLKYVRRVLIKETISSLCDNSDFKEDYAKLYLENAGVLFNYLVDNVETHFNWIPEYTNQIAFDDLFLKCVKVLEESVVKN